MDRPPKPNQAHLSDILDGIPQCDSSDPTGACVVPDGVSPVGEKFQGTSVAPYHLPRFEDDVPKRVVVERLERALDVEVRVVGVNTVEGEDWTIRIDGEPVGTIGRRRSRHGYTVFEMESAEFVAFVLSRAETVT